MVKRTDEDNGDHFQGREPKLELPINPRREAVDGSSYKELQTRGLMSIGVGL